MTPRPISTLRGCHDDETVYVVGSGSSLDDLDPADYADAVTVTLNRVPLCWPLRPTYALTKYHCDAHDLLSIGIRPCVSRGDRGFLPASEPLADAAYFWDHLQQPNGWAFDLDALWPTGSNQLINAQTIQMTALHFAAHLGAARIVLLGSSGQGHVKGYYPDFVHADQAAWLDTMRPLARAVAARVEAVYGCVIEGLAS